MATPTTDCHRFLWIDRCAVGPRADLNAAGPYLSRDLNAAAQGRERDVWRGVGPEPLARAPLPSEALRPTPRQHVGGAHGH